MGKPPYSFENFEDDADEPADPRKYEAFHSQDKLSAIEIIRATGPGRCPSYSYLLDISYGRKFHQAFMLFFTFMVVKVTGENLKDVIDAIRLRKCSRIQEYHPDEFDPPEKGAPVIHKIEITMRILADAMAESEKSL